MPRNRQSEEVKILNWFQTEPWDAVKTIFSIIQEIVRTRKLSEDPSPMKTRKMSKKKVSPAPTEKEV